jgi:hypothetical protein
VHFLLFFKMKTKPHPLLFRWLYGDAAKKIPLGATVLQRRRYLYRPWAGRTANGAQRRSRRLIYQNPPSYYVYVPFEPSFVETTNGYGISKKEDGYSVMSYMMISIPRRS